MTGEPTWTSPAGGDTLRFSSPSVGSSAKQWPVVAVFVLSLVGVVMAVLTSHLVYDLPGLALASYLVVLLGGCALIGYRRYEAIRATRTGGGFADLSVQPLEKLAIITLALACLAHGAVLAYEAAGWSVWF